MLLRPSAIKNFLISKRLELESFHNGWERENGVLFNQRLVFNGDWEGNTLPENQLIQPNLDLLVDLLEEYLSCSEEELFRAIEVSLTASYSMNKTTHQSVYDKKEKIKAHNKAEKTLMKSTCEDKVEKLRRSSMFKDHLRSMDIGDDTSSNRKGALTWQCKDALKRFRIFLKENISGKRCTGYSKVLGSHAFPDEYYRNTTAICVAILNYMGVYISFSQAQEFFKHEYKRHVLTPIEDYTKLDARLDWLLEKK